MPTYRLTIKYGEGVSSELGSDSYVDFDITVKAPGLEQADLLLRKYVSKLFRHTPGGAFLIGQSLFDPALIANTIVPIQPLLPPSEVVYTIPNWTFIPAEGVFSGTISVNPVGITTSTTNTTGYVSVSTNTDIKWGEE